MPCNEEDEFFIMIDFDHQNNSDQFILTGNGNTYGTYSYEDLPIQVGPFNGATPIDLGFVATDANNIFCFDAIETGTSPARTSANYLTWWLKLENVPVRDTYIAHINFDHEGNANNSFDFKH
jgi:hypothetical protein